VDRCASGLLLDVAAGVVDVVCTSENSPEIAVGLLRAADAFAAELRWLDIVEGWVAGPSMADADKSEGK
jgi:hypothetical protein